MGKKIDIVPIVPALHHSSIPPFQFNPLLNADVGALGGSNEHTSLKKVFVMLTKIY
jgi:hypothetical protein